MYKVLFDILVDDILYGCSDMVLWYECVIGMLLVYVSKFF